MLLTAGITMGGQVGPLPAQARDTTRTVQDSTPVSLAPLVVSISRNPVRADRVGFAVTVLTAEALRDRHRRTAADALRNVAGAFIDEAAGPGGPTIVRLRGGEEVFTQILVDGVRINQNGGFFDFQGLTVGNLDRIEIVRGPHSALYGSSAVSGAINFLTRTGATGPPRASLAAEAGASSGEGGSYGAAGEISGGTDAVRYAAGLSRSFDRGIYRLPHDVGTSEASLRLDADAGSAVRLAAILRWWSVDANLPVRDPGATRAPLDPNARNERDRLVSSVTARFDGSSLQHTIRASTYREGFVYDDRRDDVPQSDDFFVFDADFRLDSRLWRTALEYGGTFSRGPGATVLSWGVLAEREDLEDRTSGEFGDGVQQLDRTSTAVFGEIMLAPASWLDVIAGARAEHFEGLSTSFTPRASAVIHLNELSGRAPATRSVGRVALRVAAGRAYKAPNLQEQFLDNPFIVSNPGLRPETSTSWEIGLDASTGDDRWSAGATFFRQRYDDLIRSVQFDTTGRQQNRNLGASRAHGFEWHFALRPAEAWRITGDGVWISTRILENTGLPPQSFPVGQTLPFRPAIIAGSSIEWDAPGPARLRIRADAVGRQSVLTERFAGRRVELPAYVLAGLTLDWSFTRGWNAWMAFDNLLGHDYETAFDRRGIPATGRAGIQWRN